MAVRPDYRLPAVASPERYELEFSPDLSASTFEGTETVTLSVAEATRELVLNAVDLDIRNVVLTTPSGARLPGRVSYDEPEQRATLTFAEMLEPGDGYRLGMDFEGTLNKQLQGFYRSTFTDSDGNEHVIASTQFEPTDARRAFPCWDEPEFKAVFSVALVVPEDTTAISNAAEVSSSRAGRGKKRVVFADTMRMSTYLVAFVVGPFEASAAAVVDGVDLRIVSVPGKSHLRGFAEEAAAHSLSFLSGYFDIPYPGDKLDHIGIPDFSFGAMENLGCVTYRESSLLTDPARASQLELERVASVIAHETAHMWFGDLVTMRWWNGIWLNEAFATFMELITTDDFRPEWKVWTGFAAGRSAAMVTDGLHATRPIEFDVGRPEEAEAMFDLLTYQKGGSVLRMLEQYLGPDVFRAGISHYLRTHAYGNTETGDLWDALESVSGEPVRSMMDSWIRQGGHPLVSVREPDEPGDGSVLELSQRRFLYKADGGPGGDETWMVPVNLRASVGGVVEKRRLLLGPSGERVAFDGPIDWVVVNDGAWGFYRVLYSPALRSKLTAGGLDGLAARCDPLERFGLLTDAWAEFAAGLSELSEWAELSMAFRGDDDADVWAALAGIASMLDALAGDGDRDHLRSFVGRLAGPAWSRLGWDASPGEPARTATARARVISTLGLIAADPDVIAEASRRFEDHLAGTDDLAPDVASAVLRITVAFGDAEVWDRVLDRYLSERSPQEKLRYLYALAATRDPEVVARTLDLALGDEVRSQDGPFLIAALLGRRDTGAQAWGWLLSNWDALNTKFPNTLVLRMFEALPGLADEQVAASVREFCASRELAIAGPRLDQILERLGVNVALAARVRGTYGSALA